MFKSREMLWAEYLLRVDTQEIRTEFLNLNIRKKRLSGSSGHSAGNNIKVDI
jgi:hypothetical protein